jgi:hypothetical protein
VVTSAYFLQSFPKRLQKSIFKEAAKAMYTTLASNSTAKSPVCYSSEIHLRLALWNTDTLCQDACHKLGLSPSQAVEAVELYKQFWVLLARYPQIPLVPPAVVDRIWHLHILDTRRYREDCLFLVGEFVDHQPHRGEISESGEVEDAWTLTLALFEHCFGCKVRSQLQTWQNLLSSPPQGQPINPHSPQPMGFDPTERGECYRLC